MLRSTEIGNLRVEATGLGWYPENEPITVRAFVDGQPFWGVSFERGLLMDALGLYVTFVELGALSKQSANDVQALTDALDELRGYYGDVLEDLARSESDNTEAVAEVRALRDYIVTVQGRPIATTATLLQPAVSSAALPTTQVPESKPLAAEGSETLAPVVPNPSTQAQPQVQTTPAPDSPAASTSAPNEGEAPNAAP